METNQPGLPGFRFSQTLSLIKVAMMANKEQEETIPDDSYQITCTKISQEFKEEVIQKYAQVFTGLGRLEKPLHTEKDPTDTRCNLPPPTSRTIPTPGTSGKSERRVRWHGEKRSDSQSGRAYWLGKFNAHYWKGSWKFPLLSGSKTTE